MQLDQIGAKVVLWLVGMGYVAILFLVFIAWLLFRNDISKLESIIRGPLLPLTTVAAVVGASTLLALMGILSANAISAIFGGIVGYVLGGLYTKYTDKKQPV
ncbi:MAG: hypothetical protein WBB67_06425 [bacterium]